MDSAAVGPQRPAPCVMYLLFITQPLFVFVFVYNCVSACLVLPAALYLIFFRILYVHFSCIFMCTCFCICVCVCTFLSPSGDLGIGLV